jgi:hypothetical protein
MVLNFFRQSRLTSPFPGVFSEVDLTLLSFSQRICFVSGIGLVDTLGRLYLLASQKRDWLTTPRPGR